MRSTFASLAAFALLALQATSVAAGVFNCVGGTVYVIAHADDDLLFQSPDLLTDMQSGACVTTIIMTAGDSGTTGSTYFSARESGNQAAYANMAGVANTYTEVSAMFGGQTITVRTLKKKPQVQKVFFRLPDGNMDGSGFSTTGYQSLRMLYFGSISKITNQPKTATFTLATLKQALGEIITARQPSFVRTLDYMSDYDAGDHADHLTVGRLASEIAGQYASNATLAGYMGYPVQNLPPTLDTSSSQFQGKSNAFFAYTPYDSAECQAYAACVAAGRGESYWLVRQYIVNEWLAEQSYMGSAEAPVTLPDGTNIAGLADVDASSDWPTQPASAAIDGNIQGYPGNSSAEWSSYGQTVGAWIQLTWDDYYNISSIVLNDRPNLNDWMTGGTLTFSDNTTVSFGALANDGSATLISLPGNVVTDSIFLYVTSVSSATGQVGLAEFQVYGTLCPGCGPSSSLNGTTTTQTSAGTVSGAAASQDLALVATASASSSFAAQGPEKAIDGYIDGYKEDGTGNSAREWASYGQRANAWLNLTWPAYYMVDSLVLYDRPNSNDQITSGTVKFSDGSSLPITTLNNAGGATVFNLTKPVNISSLQFTVNSVSLTTSSVGLAEIAAFYSLPQTPVNITDSSNTTTTLPIQGDLDDEDWADDLALLPGVDATSSTLVDGQDPGNAINGDANGYKEDGTGDAYQEWATRGEGAGAWINLTWPYPISVKQISLFDRPNLADQVTGGRFTFDNGAAIKVGALNNDGSATNFSIPNIVTSSILFTVTSVSSSTSSVGLSEFAVFGSVANSTVSNNTTTSTNSTLTANSTMSANSTASATASGGLLGGVTSLFGGLFPTASASKNASSSFASSTAFNYSSGAVPTGRVNASSSAYNSSLPVSTGALNLSASAVPTGYNASASGFNYSASGAVPTSSSFNLSASGAVPTSSGFNLSSAVPTNASSAAFASSTGYNASSLASSSATANASSTSALFGASGALPTGSAGLNLSSILPSASAAASINASSSGVSGFGASSSSFVNSTVGFTTSTRSSSQASSTASSIASSASSILSSASSVVSSAASVASSKASSASSAVSSMVTSTRASSASSTAVASSSVVSSAVSSAAATSTGLPVAPAQAASVNIAQISGVKATASSSITKSPPAGAIDGNIGGVSALGLGKPAQEWVADGTKGQWIELNWPNQYLMRDIVLYGRVNALQSVSSAVLNFTDGTVITTGALSSSGSHVSLGAGLTSSGVRVTITGVGLTTTQAGLAEIQIYNKAAPTTGLVGALGNAVGQTLGGLLGTLGIGLRE
ncbi:hypothetical protein JCM10207_008130 [Rhodosporidiobolus poonsookiae]